MNMLVTDNGREFKNTDMTEICNLTLCDVAVSPAIQCAMRTTKQLIKYLKTILDGKDARLGKGIDYLSILIQYANP